jgi:mono/diheme cytochrome c family protein
MKSDAHQRIFAFLPAFIFITTASVRAQLPPPANQEVEFVADVQPIFIKSCLTCHGPDRQEGGLRLDQKQSAMLGGESGPAILPGKSLESRLIRLVAGLEKDLVMPKKGERLTSKQIGILRAWIDQGAAWPDGLVLDGGSDKANLWTFKPAAKPTPPAVKNEKWGRNPIDRFILAKLEQENLSPSPEADRRTLIRRLSFDVTGLPPSPEEVREFQKDSDPQAYEKLVDQLLASPHYGERWARHWLDVVHFGETHGYDKDKPRRNAWPYRDYVIRAFNDDKPYSRFVQEQLAGDVLFPDEPDGVVATGFIAAGPWDYVGHVELPESKTDGLIARYNDRDDMVMTTMSTFQSLTVHCARCHDHKFDPISQREYYSLQAVFAGVDRAERTFDSDAATHARRRRLLAEKQIVEEKFAALTNEISKITSPEIAQFDMRLGEADKQLATLPKPGDEKKSPSNGYHSEIAESPETTKWVEVDLGKVLSVDEVRLVPARPTDFPDTPGFGFPLRWRVTLSEWPDAAKADSLADYTNADYVNPGDNPVVLAANGVKARYVRVVTTRLWERTKDYVFALGELQVFSDGTNVARGATVTAMDSIEAGRWAKYFLVDGFDSRSALEKVAASEAKIARRKELETEGKALRAKREQQVVSMLDERVRAEWTAVTNRLEELNRELAALPAPQNVYAAASSFKAEGSFVLPKSPRPVHFLRRGDVKRPEELMKAGALGCVPGMPAELRVDDEQVEGDRRAALAKWITDSRNHLTRRSIVNRVWHYHFGRGIVETPNDFGHMGGRPSHPELLDWLAFWFQEDGESFKKLHRLILMSATYRQSSAPDAQKESVDADNRLLWRMNRQRLDAESVHDATLSVAGALDLTMGGPSVQQFFFKDDHSPVYDYARYDLVSPGSDRRSIYRFIVRSVTDPFMDTLDCPDPSVLADRRTVTTTALQALALLNNPFVIKQSQRLAERVRGAGQSLDKQIEATCWLVWNRPPTGDETESLAGYAQKHGLENFCRLLFNSSEFVFLD